MATITTPGEAYDAQWTIRMRCRLPAIFPNRMAPVVRLGGTNSAQILSACAPVVMRTAFR
jgi:hypothetical protein